MKGLTQRSLVLLLAGLALGSVPADAARRSGGGFGGSRSSGRSYRAPSAPTYRAPSRPQTPAPPSNSARTSPYTRPPATPKSPALPKTPAPPKTPATPSTSQRQTSLPPNASVAQSAANKAAAARVTAAQLSGWKNARLPAGVSRSALTYSATPSSQYRYQLQPGRYYPYPQSYYRQHGIGYDLLKYALIFTAVSSVADALDGPDVVVGNVDDDLSGVTYGNPAPAAPAGPNLWTYAGVGFLTAAAAWFLTSRRK